MKLCRFAILSSVFVCFSTTAPAFAATLVVDDGADCPQADFNSIQAAVLVAQPGDKILVCPGVYAESVVITIPKSDLRIEAQAALGAVVLKGTPAQPFGFHLLDTTGVLVQGFTVEGFGSVDPTNPINQGANIRIEGGSRNTLRKNVTTLSSGGDGIQVMNSSANLVEQNSSFDNNGPLSDGITVTGAASFDNIIRHNETYQNVQTGINVIGPTGRGNVVFGNRSHDNGTGIRNVALQGNPAFAAHGNVIENNHVFANVQGIIVGLSTAVTVRNNRSESNTQFGIRLQNGATDNLVEKNEAFHNAQDGIRLEGGPIAVANNIVQLNHVRRNGRDGIRVFPNSAGNTIERNVIHESGEHDAHDDSAGPGTGGTANLWMNNECETENRPGLCEHPDH